MKVNLNEEVEYERLEVKILRSPLLLIAELVLLVGAALSIVSLGEMFSADYRAFFVDFLETKQITDPAAAISWFFVILIVRALISVLSIGLAIGLARILIPMHVKGVDGLKIGGFSMIGGYNRVLVWVIYVMSAGAAALFVYRLIVYVIGLIENTQEFLFPLMAVIFGEIAMLLAAALVVALLVKLLHELSALAYQSYYMLKTGKTETHVEPVCYWLIFGLAATLGYLAYFFWGDVLAVISLAFLSLAFLLFGICIKLFKKEVEWIKYRNYKSRKKNGEG